jgi:hypothetical protein
MIDGVSPPAGMRPLSLIRPPAWPLVRAQRPAAADSGSRELAAVVPPSGDDGCGCSCPGLACPRAWSVRNKVQVSGGGERVAAELGQDVAGLPDDLAGLRQGGARPQSPTARYPRPSNALPPCARAHCMSPAGPTGRGRSPQFPRASVKHHLARKRRASPGTRQKDGRVSGSA